MKKLAFLLVFICLSHSLVRANDNPPVNQFGLKGDNLGESLDKFRARNANKETMWESKKKQYWKLFPFCSYDMDHWPEPDLDTTLVEHNSPDEIKCVPRPQNLSNDNQTVGGVQIFPLIYTFKRDGLRSISGSFSSTSYETIRDAFIARFGPPTSRTIDELENTYGATMQGECVSWRFSDVSIYVVEIVGGTVNGSKDGGFSISNLSGEEQKRKLSAEKAAKDF